MGVAPGVCWSEGLGRLIEKEDSVKALVVESKSGYAINLGT